MWQRTPFTDPISVMLALMSVGANHASTASPDDNDMPSFFSEVRVFHIGR